MGLTIQELRSHATTPIVEEWLLNTSFPDEVSLEELLVGVLDSYLAAQTQHNTDKNGAEKINFVTNPQIRNAAFGANSSEYKQTKTLQVNCRVTSHVSNIQPLTGA